jgi:hypothetical protein
VISRRFIAPLAVAAFAMQVAGAYAQGAFPAPLPGQSAAPASSSPFPPVNGAAAAPPAASPFPPVGGAPAAAAPSAFPSGGAAPLGGGFGPPPQQQAGPAGGDDCMAGFLPLRQEAEKRGAAIKAASERRAPPDEACKLISAFSQSEVKMLSYIKANATKCGIPSNVSSQMQAGHKNTENMRQKVCAAARGGGGPGPVAAPRLSDVLGSSASLPDASAARKSGGTTFDTLNGNVLTR